MHKYLFNGGRHKSNPLKRPLSAKQEVEFEPVKKLASLSPAATLSPVLILTSSRPGSSDLQAVSETQHFSTKSFYEKPKTKFELQYARNLEKFLPEVPQDDFVPLSLDPKVASLQGEVSPSASPELHSEESAESSEQEIAVSELPNAEFQTILQQAWAKDDMPVCMALQASNLFLKQAHDLPSATELYPAEYNSFIASSVKALLMVVKKHAVTLTPQVTAAIHHRLGEIFFSETDSLELAEVYLNKAIQIATKHNMLNLKVQSELLYGQLLEDLDSQRVNLYYLDKARAYLSDGLTNLSDVFTLFQAKATIARDFSSGSALLRNLVGKQGVNPTIKLLACSADIPIKLYEGNCEEALKLIDEAKVIVTSGSFPVQVSALYDMLLLAYYVQMSDHKSTKKHIHNLSKFIESQRFTKWSGWNSDGLVRLEVPYSETDDRKITFNAQWVNSDDFEVTFQLLSGISLMGNVTQGKRCRRIFDSCLKLLKDRTATVSGSNAVISSSRNMRSRILLKLTYMRYSVRYYRSLAMLSTSHALTDILSVKHFIDKFGEGGFSDEEKRALINLVPKYMYLAALFYQRNGEIHAAKFYIFRAKAFCETLRDSLVETSVIQSALGLGCSSMIPPSRENELIIMAHIHSLTIAEFEMFGLLGSNEASDKALVLQKHTELNEIYAHLEEAMGEQSGQKRQSSDKFALLEILYWALKIIFRSKGFNLLTSIESELPSEIPEVGGFIEDLLSLVCNKVKLGSTSTHAIDTQRMPQEWLKNDINKRLSIAYTDFRARRPQNST